MGFPSLLKGLSPRRSLLMVVGGCAGLVVGAALLRKLYSVLTEKKRVGFVSKIVIYPIKSCKGIEVPEAMCTPHGLVSGSVRDRQFMVAHPTTGEFISARTHPSLVLVSVTVSESKTDLCINADGMEELRLSLSGPSSQRQVRGNVFAHTVEGLDCGEEANSWFCRYLNDDVILLYFEPNLYERHVEEAAGCAYTRQGRPNEPHAVTMFADGYPYLICTQSSIDKVNELVTSQNISWMNFRPNILVTDTEKPYAEDEWRALDINGVSLFCEKPCDRCLLPNVDPHTGKVNRKAEPFNTLIKTRRLKQYNVSKPMFGMNLILDGQPGLIAVGNVVLG